MKSYDQPRQYIKKQRLYFAEKGLYSQSYGFCSSHVSAFLICFLGWSQFFFQGAFNFMASAVILEPQENKVCHCFHCFPICHEVMGPDAMILVS